MRLDKNYRKKTGKSTSTWRLNNTLLNNQEIIEEIKEEVKKCLEMINQDGRVEGRALTLSCENTRIATGR